MKVKAKVKDTLHLDDDYSDEESVEQILKNLKPEERKILRETMEKIEKEEAEADYKEVKDPETGSEAEKADSDAAASENETPKRERRAKAAKKERTKKEDGNADALNANIADKYAKEEEQ